MRVPTTTHSLPPADTPPFLRAVLLASASFLTSSRWSSSHLRWSARETAIWLMMLSETDGSLVLGSIVVRDERQFEGLSSD